MNASVAPLDAIDHTHDVRRQSWVGSANGHPDFPLQNLPLGIFSIDDGEPRVGVAIGEDILDVAGAIDAGLLGGLDGPAKAALRKASLNDWLALGRAPRRTLRHLLFALLVDSQQVPDEVRRKASAHLHRATACRLHLPVRIGDYTDFYVGIHHATAVGKLFRPDNPLLPNYKYVPIGYHGRASSVRASGAALRRPQGQRKAADQDTPSFGPCQRLDYELELGVWVGQGNTLGQPIPIAEAAEHIGGFCLLNDWSARDLQAWEYQPLGPFLAKNFLSTVSPWLITPEALAPFRAAAMARPAGDPPPLRYLHDAEDQRAGGLALTLEVELSSAAMRQAGLPAQRLAQSNAGYMYWTVAQMLTHHASGGCDLRPGDLLGTGTLSGAAPEQSGSLLELTQGGTRSLELVSGERRGFLEDGDEVRLSARARREGFAAIGFGDCIGRISG